MEVEAIIKMTVRDGAGNSIEGAAQAQFQCPVEIFDTSKGSSSQLLDILHLLMEIHEGQYQLLLNTFVKPEVITFFTKINFKKWVNQIFEILKGKRNPKGFNLLRVSLKKSAALRLTLHQIFYFSINSLIVLFSHLSINQFVPFLRYFSRRQKKIQQEQ